MTPTATSKAGFSGFPTGWNSGAGSQASDSQIPLPQSSQRHAYRPPQRVRFTATAPSLAIPHLHYWPGGAILSVAYEGAWVAPPPPLECLRARRQTQGRFERWLFAAGCRGLARHELRDVGTWTAGCRGHLRVSLFSGLASAQLPQLGAS